MPRRRQRARKRKREYKRGRERRWDREWERRQERCKLQRVRALAAQIPEELFDRILGGMVWRSRWDDEGKGYYTKEDLGRCALVSTYWAPRCQASIFRIIELRSVQDVRDLIAMLDRPGTQIANYIHRLDSPWQNLGWPATPWLHLIPLVYRRLPFCRLGPLALEGPLRSGTRTLRTVHSALPRTVPAHNTRLHCLSLDGITFACFGDLVHLLDELRDLRTLFCYDVTWSKGPLLTSLRSSRPRAVLLDIVALYDVPFDEYCAWLLTVYRAPPRTVRPPAGDGFLPCLRAFFTSTIAAAEPEDQHYRFNGGRDATQTGECRS